MSDSSLTRGTLLAGIVIVIWTGFILVSRLGGTGSLTPFDVVAIRLATAALTVPPLWPRPSASSSAIPNSRSAWGFANARAEPP